jgi:hypothetical protein
MIDIVPPEKNKILYVKISRVVLKAEAKLTWK